MPTNEHAQFDIQRFVDAQAPVYPDVLDELRAGNKTTHWMWFIFPQLRALGRSQMARFYGLADLQEARQYLQHPVLGSRLKECTRLMLTHGDRTAQEILHKPDDIKFCSCMTLFKIADPNEPLFQEAIATLYVGYHDEMTVQLINRIGG